MKGRDFIVIPAAAVAVMALNVAISFGVVWFYSTFFVPDQLPSYYEALAMRVAPISSVIAGVPLMFIAGFLIADKRSEQKGLLAAAAVALVYVLVDTAIILGADAGGDIWIWVALSHTTKLFSAIAGAKLAATRARPQVSS